MKGKAELRTKLEKCPKCGCDSMYVTCVSLDFDGVVYMDFFKCNKPGCGQEFEVRGGWLVTVRGGE